MIKKNKTKRKKKLYILILILIIIILRAIIQQDNDGDLKEPTINTNISYYSFSVFKRIRNTTIQFIVALISSYYLVIYIFIFFAPLNKNIFSLI